MRTYTVNGRKTKPRIFHSVLLIVIFKHVVCRIFGEYINGVVACVYEISRLVLGDCALAPSASHIGIGAVGNYTFDAVFSAILKYVNRTDCVNFKIIRRIFVCIKVNLCIGGQ